MKIEKCNYQSNTSFKGLWGYKTYSKNIIKDNFSQAGYINSLPRNIELFQLDRFYPFADDSNEVVKKEMTKGIKNGVKDSSGVAVPFSETGVRLEEKLPFTRAEYFAYKAKNLQSRAIKLNEVDKKIEYFLEPLMKGLSSYKNKYANPTFKEKFLETLQVRKLLKKI